MRGSTFAVYLSAALILVLFLIARNLMLIHADFQRLNSLLEQSEPQTKPEKTNEGWVKI